MDAKKCDRCKKFDICKRFTLWYIRKGYSFVYTYFDCPWWLRPLLIFFSPDIYFAEVGRKAEDSLKRTAEDPMSEAFRVNMSGEDIEPENCPDCGGEPKVWKHETPELDFDINYCGCEKCGYTQFTSKYGDQGVKAKWNDFVKRYENAMTSTTAIFGKGGHDDWKN